MSALSFTTGAREGNARAPGALAKLLKKRHHLMPVARAQQVHGVRIAIVPQLFHEKTYAASDGLLTASVNQPLAIFTADCVPVFIYAEGSGVIGLLHAGWRGVKGRILACAVRLMQRRWKIRPAAIQAWAGPSIGSCCFEVQWDVARHFPSTRRRLGDRWGVDLARELRLQAKRLGIVWKSQKTSNGCTMQDKRYFSYRRNKTEKRQVSVIMRKGK